MLVVHSKGWLLWCSSQPLPWSVHWFVSAKQIQSGFLSRLIAIISDAHFNLCSYLSADNSIRHNVVVGESISTAVEPFCNGVSHWPHFHTSIIQTNCMELTAFNLKHRYIVERAFEILFSDGEKVVGRQRRSPDAPNCGWKPQMMPFLIVLFRLLTIVFDVSWLVAHPVESFQINLTAATLISFWSVVRAQGDRVSHDSVRWSRIQESN